MNKLLIVLRQAAMVLRVIGLVGFGMGLAASLMSIPLAVLLNSHVGMETAGASIIIMSLALAILILSVAATVVYDILERQ